MVYRTTASKVLLILWKNVLLLKSRPISTTCGIIWPLLIGFILIGMRHFYPAHNHPGVSFQKLDVDKFNEKYHG